MASSSRGFTTQLDFRLRRPVDISRGQVNGLDEPRKRKRVSFEGERIGVSRISCCCSDPVVPIRSCKSVEKCEEWRFDPKKSSHRSRIQASPSMPFASSQSCSVSKQGKFYPRCTPRNSGPQSRDSPPKRGNLLEVKRIKYDHLLANIAFRMSCLIKRHVRWFIHFRHWYCK